MLAAAAAAAVLKVDLVQVLEAKVEHLVGMKAKVN